MTAERSEQIRMQDDGCTPKKQDKSQITLPRSGKIIDQINEKKSATQQTYGKHTIKLEQELETWRQKPLEIRRISSILFMKRYKKFRNKRKPAVTLLN